MLELHYWFLFVYIIWQWNTLHYSFFSDLDLIDILHILVGWNFTVVNLWLFVFLWSNHFKNYFSKLEKIVLFYICIHIQINIRLWLYIFFYFFLISCSGNMVSAQSTLLLGVPLDFLHTQTHNYYFLLISWTRENMCLPQFIFSFRMWSIIRKSFYIKTYYTHVCAHS